MTPAIGRLFLFLDEWIGIFLLLYLWKTGELLLFAVFLPLWAIAVYVIGYRRQWDHEARHESGDAAPDPARIKEVERFERYAGSFFEWVGEHLKKTQFGEVGLRDFKNAFDKFIKKMK